MFEVVLLLVIIIFCLFFKKQNLILLLVILLPFHSFIKSLLSYYLGQGEIFAYWKECAILILAYKVFFSKHNTVDKTYVGIIGLYVLYVFLYFIFTPNLSIGLPSLRDQLFPFILLISLYSISSINFTKLVILTGNILPIIIFFHCIIGVIQMFFFNIPISMLMGRIEFINNAGYIQYQTNSARIMGFERMAGIVGGGPNGFGLFMAFGIIFLACMLLNKPKFHLINKKKIVFIRLTILFSIACILLSFSRAGWFISIIGYIILFKINKMKMRPQYVIIFFVIFLGLAFSVSSLFPEVDKIVYASVTGKEASASTRGNMVLDGLNKILDEPLGHGLGTADNRYSQNTFFTESAFINIGYEVGLFGLLFLIVIYLVFGFGIWKKEGLKHDPFAQFAFALLVPSIIVSFFSVNTYGMPYIYLWWMMLGLGLNKSAVKNEAYFKILKSIY